VRVLCVKGGLHCMHNTIPEYMAWIVSWVRCISGAFAVAGVLGDVRRVGSLGMLEPRNCDARAVIRAGQRGGLIMKVRLEVRLPYRDGRS